MVGQSGTGELAALKLDVKDVRRSWPNNRVYQRKTVHTRNDSISLDVTNPRPPTQ
jgi:hypothetical protein